MVFSDNFKKQLKDFEQWAVNVNIKIINNTTQEQVLTPFTELPELQLYTEPGRNKLEKFLKMVNEHYTILKEKQQINCFKMLIQEFKTNPYVQTSATHHKTPPAQTFKQDKLINYDKYIAHFEKLNIKPLDLSHLKDLRTAI